MEPIKWDLMEQFRNQQKIRQEKMEEQRRAIQDAQDRMNQATQKNQQFMFRQNQGGDDEDRKQAETELNEARGAYQSAIQSMQESNSSDEITSDKLVSDWNENMLPKIKEQHVQPIAERMRKARYSYLQALQDFSSMMEAYRGDITEATNQGYNRIMQGGQPFGAPDINELPLIRQDHLNAAIYQRELPDEVKKGMESD